MLDTFGERALPVAQAQLSTASGHVREEWAAIVAMIVKRSGAS